MNERIPALFCRFPLHPLVFIPGSLATHFLVAAMDGDAAFEARMAALAQQAAEAEERTALADVDGITLQRVCSKCGRCGVSLSDPASKGNCRA